jgi:subtilase family serine protease
MKIKSVTLLSRFLVMLTLFAFPCARLEAQISNVPARITQAVDETNLVTLKGNVHPLARAEFDQGAVSDGQPLHRMLLLLQRSADQEADLQKLLDDQQNKSAANYHAWLTPAQFGQQFGPADTDIQTVTGWLQSHGFQITNVTQGRTLIEFSGNAAQVRNAFHTEMHKYLVNGATHLANASDPQIPAAFAPVVAGPVSLNNFPISSHIRKLGSFHRAKGSSLAQPLYTFSGGCTPAGCFALGPADFATIYNSAPLLTGSPKIDGTGQTIAIVGESDIDPTDVTDFQTMFGMTPSFSAAANIIVNGADPGVNDSEGESDLDVQWAGAVAPGATVKFVTSEPTETTAGIVLSAIFIVENNFAGVLSESFGACEQQIGTLNQFHNALWEQAAAQGITVMVSAGDGGSAGCDNFDTAQTATQGLAVSGFASTPFNVAVGGTDFDEINKWSQYWSATNNSMNQSSALSYIPEIPWNENCAQLGIDGCGSSAPNGSLNIVAGSGGVSTLYAKPSWQSGTGVPNDGHRDLPDVSLFASPGFDGTFYIVCQKDVTDAPSCNLSDLTFQGVGGTSASAPAFAGIMALVNQSQATAQNPAPRQGNANYVLYSLFKKQTNTSPALNCSSSAASKSCTFYDITHGNSGLPESTGTNSVPCAGGSPNCSVSVAGSSDGVLVTATTPATEAYTAGTGYDLASGLGSVNVANLVKNWASVTFLPSTTTLSATVSGNSVTSIGGITHGTPVNVSSNVAAGQGAAGTPSGQIVLMATPNPTPASISANFAIEALSLTSGAATGTGVILPGGTYNLTAHYQGDGTFGSSDSTPGIPVTITSESSKTLISIPTFNSTTGLETGNAPTSLVYGSLYLARIDVGNAQAKLSYPPQQICSPPACPTGTITWTDAVNGNPAAPLDGGTFALNSAGFTEDQLINLSGGTHVLSASYSGDTSFGASSSTYALTVTPVTTTLSMAQLAGSLSVQSQFDVDVYGNTQAVSGGAPTGTVTIFDGATQLGNPVPVNGIPAESGSSPSFSTGVVYLTLLTAGSHTLTARYSGDANYTPSSATLTVNILNLANAKISVSPSSVIYGNTVTLTGLIDTVVPASNASLKPSGTVSLGGSADGPIMSGVATTIMADPSGNWEILATATITPSNSEIFGITYSGDSNYESAYAQSSELTVMTPDFSVSPNPAAVSITAGQTGASVLTVAPLSTSNSTVNLACTVPNMEGTTCSLLPNSLNLSNSTSGTANLTLTTLPPSAPVAAASAMKMPGATQPGWKAVAWMSDSVARLAGLLLILFLARKHPRRFASGLAFASALTLALGCGGGSGQIIGGDGGQQVPTSTTVTATTTKLPLGNQVTVTATVSPAPTAGGTVTFWEQGNGGALSLPINLFGGTAQAQLNLTLVGTHQIYAIYSGAGEDQQSQSANYNVVITGSSFAQVSGTTGSITHYTNITVTIQ